MRVAALYDIHGNLPALEAVLRDVRRERVDEIVVGGDALPGPMPRETLDYLLALDIPVRFIRGNGDRVVLMQMTGADLTAVPPQYRDGIRWNSEQLAVEHRAELAAWPLTARLEIPQIGSVVFCHATPRNDTEIFTRLTREERLLPVFQDVEASLVVCGHTHMQFDRRVGRLRVVNAGSVGMPFQAPGAYWLLLGPDIELRRTPYDLEEAARRIRATAYPQAEDFAANNVLTTPSETDTLQAFGRAELK